MAKTELDYLNYCKRLIEEELRWINPQKWKQRDYLNLIDLIENSSGISISLSTIKRIWKKEGSGIPQPATLDALAKFLRYDNWLHFKKSNQDLVSSEPIKSGKKPIRSGKKLPFRTVAIISGIVLISVTVIFLIRRMERTPRKGSLSYDPDDVAFSCAYSAENGVPNTVIFNYNVQNVNADSFFIQLSWDELQRERIRKTDRNLTSVYYYPGFHEAKLIADDSIIMQTVVKVYTKGWLAMAREGYMDKIPVYIRNRDPAADGVLHVTREDLDINRAVLDQETLVSYYYVNDFAGISSSEFDFKTRVRCDSIFNYTCPHVTVVILGEENVNFVPLIAGGCVGSANVKMGDALVSGRNTDLSAFGVDVYRWQELEIRVINSVASIFLNEELVIKLPFNSDIGNIVGFNINFTGTGAVDYVNLAGKDDAMVYQTDFDTPGGT